MAQLKSTSVTGNLSVTGNVVASKIQAGDTMTGPLAVTGTGYFDNDLKIKGHVFAYNYSRDGNNAPAIIWDKNGGNYTGVGSHNLTDTIWFGAVNPENFTWVDDYKQKWKFNGSVEAESYNATSDARLKENFQQFIPKKSILDLPIYKFDFINGTKNQIGCKAQDLQEICPEIVSEDGDGYLSIQESKIVYLLIDEIKKLKGQLNLLMKGGC